MNHLEDEHQKALIQWCDFQRMNDGKSTIGDFLIHIPNGGKRNGREAARLKAQGVRAGFPDLFLFYPSGSYHGLAIEMKKPIIESQSKPRVTDSQKRWLSRLKEQDYQVAICYGWHEAREVIKKYLKM